MPTFLCASPPALPAPAGSHGPAGAQRLALATDKRWDDRRVLHVRYMDEWRNPALEEYVTGLLLGPLGWPAVCGLQLVFDQSPEAEIRIAFATTGASWSYLGNDPIGLGQQYPTMVLNLDPNGTGTHNQRPVLHEFGHAYGFIHGQLSPLAAVIDIEAARAYYVEQMGWTEAQFQAQVVRGRDWGNVQAIADDWESIMYYVMPGFMWVDGQDRKSSAYISVWDAYGAATWYGPPRRPLSRLWLPLAARMAMN